MVRSNSEGQGGRHHAGRRYEGKIHDDIIAFLEREKLDKKYRVAKFGAKNGLILPDHNIIKPDTGIYHDNATIPCGLVGIKTSLKDRVYMDARHALLAARHGIWWVEVFESDDPRHTNTEIEECAKRHHLRCPEYAFVVSSQASKPELWRFLKEKLKRAA